MWQLPVSTRSRTRVLAAVLATLLVLPHAVAARQSLRVGVFENPPIVFQAANGAYSGLAVEILEQVAQLEDWKIQYRHGSWKEILELLDAAQIDLIVGIGYSEERSRIYDFTEQALVSNWGVIFRDPRQDITSLFDLAGKRIALMTDSIHSREFERLLKEFGIVYLPVYVDDYRAVLQAIADGRAEAGAINRLYSLMYAHEHDVVATTIVFNPVEVRYASPAGRGAGVLDVLDGYLQREKLDPLSFYQQAVNRWLQTASRQPLPAWVGWLVALTVLLLLATLAFNLMLKRQVRSRTRELELHRTQLEELVRERTSALNTANAELEAFSYSVSHDLRAPLRSIDGFCRILSDEYHELLDAQGREYLGRVIRNANKMGRLIDDLLNLSRISRGSMTLQAVDLSHMARQLVDEIKSGYARRELSVSIQDGVTVQADRNLLRVAMMNLLDNAIKYSGRKEHPRVEFGIEQRDGGPAYFVRDNGAGFDMKYAEKLFTPFQRLHSESEFEGTGVGLATVARIILRHQGRVWAEAAPGRGASFYFTLG